MLKNKIQSELINSSYTQQRPEIEMNKPIKEKSNVLSSCQYTDAYFNAKKHPRVELTSSTMNLVPSSVVPTPSIVETSFIPQFIKLCFLVGNGVTVKDIPIDSTVLQLRYYLCLENVVSYASLSGWRLLFNNQVLSDDSLISSYYLPQGAILSITEIVGDASIPFPVQSRDSINAATESHQIVNNQTQVFVRTIDYSRHSQKQQPQQFIQTEHQVKPVEMLPVDEVMVEVDDYFPILHRPGYYMIPSHFDMQYMSKDEVEHIQEFTVGKEGAGEITWEGETDVCYLNLDDRVVIDRDLNDAPFVQLYAPPVYLKAMPEVGKELNKPATIRLFNMFPKGLRTKQGLVRFEELLKRQVAQMGGEWIEYDSITGILVFKVLHFFCVCFSQILRRHILKIDEKRPRRKTRFISRRESMSESIFLPFATSRSNECWYAYGPLLSLFKSSCWRNPPSS